MDALINALGRTLMHSLWQGALLAVVTMAILLGTRRAAAALRYQLLVSALLVFALATALTFSFELEKAERVAGTARLVRYPDSGGVQAPFGRREAVVSLSALVIGYLTEHSRQLVVLWFLVVLVRGVQLAAGFRTLSHLRRSPLGKVDERWTARLAVLSDRLGVRQVIGMAESALVTVPLVIGHLKPIILIPAGMLTALPPVEIDAIMVHELAHIRRKDYLVNLLQSFLEVIFFFHPAVLWLSSRIRVEREHCCDDIALAHTSNKVSYVRALVACQEFQHRSPAFAMAFHGQRGALLNRVKRITSGSIRTLNVGERATLSVALLLVALFTFAFTQSDSISKAGRSVQKAVTRLSADDHEEPLARLAPLAPRSKIAPPARVAKLAPPDVPALPDRESLVSAPDTSKALSRFKADSIRQSLRPLSNVLSGKLNPMTVVSSPTTLPSARPAPPAAAKTPDTRGLITTDLLRDGIIAADDSSISFKLSNQELIVNGVRQPDEVFTRYRKKFVPPMHGQNTWTLYSNYTTETRTTP